MSNRGDGTITVIDHDTLNVIATIPIGGGGQSPIIDNGLIWFCDVDQDRAVVFDAKTFVQRAVIPVGQKPYTAPAGYGRIWVPNHGENTVSVIDPSSFKVITTITVGTQPYRPVVAYDKVTVAGATSPDLYVIDSSNYGTEFRNMADGAYMPTPGLDVLWVANNLSNTVTVFDPSTYEIVTQFTVPGGPQKPVVFGDYVGLDRQRSQLRIPSQVSGGLRRPSVRVP